VDVTAVAFARITFPTTIGGAYVISSTTTKGGGIGTVTQIATTVNVSGIAVTQGTLKGVTAGEAVTGNSAKVKIFFPTHTGGETYKVVSSGVGSITGKTDTTGSSTTISGTADASSGYLYTNAANTTAAAMELSLTSATSGVQTITVQAIDAGTGVASALYSATVTWGAAPTYKSATAFINTTLGSESVANVTTKSSSATYSATAVARIDVRQFSSTDTTTAVVTGSGNVKTVVVTTSGAGQVDSSSGGAARSSTATVATSTTADGVDEFYLFADGRPGDATVSVTVDGVSVASWTWTFLGAATSLKEDAVNSPTKTYIGVGETGTVSVLAYDANSKLATIPTLTVTSDTATTASAVAGTNGSATVTGVAAGKTSVNFCSGACASATVKVAIPVEVTKITAKTVTIAFDKTSYEPGEKMTLTVTAVDSNGRPVADGSRALFAAALTSNVSFGGASVALPAASVTLAGGVATYILYAPSAAGTITVTGKEGTATDSTTKAAITSAPVAVVNSALDAATAAAELAEAAAQDATDAALDATEAATLAGALAQEAVDAVADLSAQVATLISALKKQITTLTNLVIKIQKKVKA
jgi:hypothetical protein